jgi:diphthamide synthase (EF-2-diphthine--ammonia ligase)
MTELQSNISTIVEGLKNNQDLRNTAYLKLAEECSELAAELIQKVLHPLHTDDNTEIIEEMGDVNMRFMIVYELLTKEEQKSVVDRTNFKVNKHLKRMSNGKI